MSDEPLVLRFVRHGATAANSAGLRCGGDLDLPMTALGHEQAQRIAERVAQLQPPVGLIVTSDLRRTRETAVAIKRRQPGIAVVVEPAFAERHLGQWNLLPIHDSQPWLEAGMTRPAANPTTSSSAASHAQCTPSERTCHAAHCWSRARAWHACSGR